MTIPPFVEDVAISPTFENSWPEDKQDSFYCAGSRGMFFLFLAFALAKMRVQKLELRLPKGVS
jgi:hypothetical protein